MNQSDATRAMNAALDEMAACRAAAAALARARQELGSAPDMGRAAAGARFQSPAADRLRDELTGMASAVRDAEGRLDELVRLLAAAALQAEQRITELARAVPDAG
jgi:hypothetical protein